MPVEKHHAPGSSLSSAPLPSHALLASNVTLKDRLKIMTREYLAWGQKQKAVNFSEQGESKVIDHLAQEMSQSDLTSNCISP